MIKRVPAMMALLAAILMTGCSVAPSKIPPLKTVTHVDLPRFMGPWYVIGTIPRIVEKNNVGTMDIYGMPPVGMIASNYGFRRAEHCAKTSEKNGDCTLL